MGNQAVHCPSHVVEYHSRYCLASEVSHKEDATPAQKALQQALREAHILASS